MPIDDGQKGIIPAVILISFPFCMFEHLSEAQKGRVWKYIQNGNGENARGFHHAAVVEPFDFVFVCICYIFLMFILIIFNMFPKRNI